MGLPTLEPLSAGARLRKSLFFTVEAPELGPRHVVQDSPAKSVSCWRSNLVPEVAAGNSSPNHSTFEVLGSCYHGQSKSLGSILDLLFIQITVLFGVLGLTGSWIAQQATCS